MSAIMAINNVSMEEQIGMLTGVTEITRNASSASRGLVMISSRLTQVLDDTSSTGKKLTEIYNKLGIALKDESGQLRGHYEILGDLAAKWNTLSENEQKYIALTSAGARQQQNFVSLMENWSQVAKATATAYGSLGSAQKENEKVMDSVAKKVEILKSQFQQLVIGDGGLQEVAKTFLNIGIALLKFANSDVGQAVIATTALITALNLLHKAFSSKLVTSIMATINEIVSLIATEISATGVTNGLAFAVKGLTTAIMESPLVLAGIVIAGIAGIVAIMDKLIVTIEESKERLNELSNTIQQDEQDLESLKNQLKEIEQSIESINNQEEISITDEHELEQLKNQSEEIQRHIQLKEQELEVSKQLAEEEAKRNLKTSGVEISSSFSTTQSEALKFYTEQIEDLTKKQKNLEEQGKNNTKEYQNLTEKISDVKNKGIELAKSLQQDADALTSTDNETQQLKKDTIDLVNSWLDATDANAKYKHELESKLDAFSEGGNVDLKLRPVIDTEELNRQGYDAGEGFATVFTHTFTNEANDLAINFTPIMTDENGEYIGVMQKDAFEQYCNDVVNGVHDDYKNLQIGIGFKKEDYDDFIGAAEDAAQETHELSEAYVIATGAADNYIRTITTYNEAVEEFGESSDEANEMLKEFAKNLGISEEELIANANAMGLSVDAYYNCALAIKQADASIDNFQSSIKTLTSAVDEYNESQEFSIDTVQALLQLSPEYLGLLINENGQLKLNEQAIIDKANALIEERKQTALQMAYEKLAAIERGNNQTAAQNESSAIDGNTSSLDAETTALSKNTIEQYANRIARNDKSKGTAASEVVRELENELKILDKIGNSYSSITSSAKKAGGAGKSGAKSATNAQKDLNKELEKTKSNYEKVISYINKQYDRKTNDLSKEKDSATKPIEDEIKALEKEKDAFSESLQAEIDKREQQRDKYVDLIEDKINAEEKERDALIESIEDKIDALEKERDVLIESVDDKITALEEEKDTILDNIEAETTALKEQKEERQKYWDAQIDALKKANDERKDAIELQEKLDALERARNTKVKIYKEGQGFVYDVDQTKVAEAQKALDEYLSQKAYEDELERLTNLKNAEMDNYSDRIDALNKFKDQTSDAYQKQINDLKKYRTGLQDEYKKQIDNLKEHKDALKKNYDTRIDDYKDYKDRIKELFDAKIDDLNNYKDSVEKNYDDQIDALNEYKDALEQHYDDEIEMYNNYKDQFEDMVNAYQEQQDRLLAEQLTGISFENDNWMTRLDNLANFVNEYNRLQAQLDTGTTDATNTASMSSGGGGGGVSTGVSGTTTTKTVTNQDTPNNQYSPTQNSKGTVSNSTGKTGYVPTSVTDALGTNSSGTIKSHASGVNSIREDEIAIVGENPNKEIVLGSKINNGELMSLEKGAGVVNADSSKTLASMLNQVGKFGSSGFGSGNGTLNNNINNDSLVVNGVTIEGSNISDPQTFVNGLLSLKTEALQRAYRHR